MRVGGPYSVEVTLIGRQPGEQQNIMLNLGQDLNLDFELRTQAVAVEELRVTLEDDEVLNPDRTGAATFIDSELVAQLPSVNRSTRDLIRLDPRNDGNFSFGGRNWLFNNITLDGSYFNNSFGLDDPAMGGQTASEPIPYDAVEQVEVSIAPFDVRESGFTGANVNIVTKSGTNNWEGSVYTFLRNESLLGNTVRGQEVVANPDLSFNQSGFTFSGPIARDKAFFFLAGEMVRRDDPGTNFVAAGATGVGQSRVDPATMDAIRDRMSTVYDYDTGDYEGFVHETNSDKLIAKLDWNVNENNNLSFRYSYLDAERAIPPHPFVLSFNNTGRGPNSSSLPFQNAGYAINNELSSFAVELNSRSSSWANRFFASYNRQRDFRAPFSADFPTIDIGEDGVTYTTLGHEPFSINNILDTDTWQLTNNFSLFRGNHVLTFGANFELFSFFNSFNFGRHGFWFLPDEFGGTTFESLDEFFDKTDPNSPNFIELRDFIGGGLFKGEVFDIAQLGLYVQDEFPVSDRVNLTMGLRVDFPMYLTDPVDNPWARGLTLLDENRNPETVDQSKLAGATPLFAPRIGFNWDVTGDRTTQIRGGTGIFTGRVPLVWIGNVFSNPGENPNLFPFISEEEAISQGHMTNFESILQASFAGPAAMDPDFKWPQLWMTNIAIDHLLPGDILGTLEFMYGKDINNIIMRNSNLVAPQGTLAQDGRPYYGGAGNNDLNAAGDGVFVLDNTSEGHNFNISTQLRKRFGFGLAAQMSYAFTEAKNRLRSSEIAGVLWSSQPNQGDPNNINLAHSEFGQRHRIVGAATWDVDWSETLGTQFGIFMEIAQGNRFAGAGGNRYSFIYSGDVNGDDWGGNDLIYIPRDASEIQFDPFVDASGATVSTGEQWAKLDAFISQDDYLSQHRGEIAERNGLLNPWYQSIDLRVLQNIGFDAGGKRHTLQLNFDILNFTNLLSSDWGVRKFASPAATSPLTLSRFDGSGEPVFMFTGPSETFIDDPSEFSRWRIQLGVKYLFN
jgi:hypothetical protein